MPMTSIAVFQFAVYIAIAAVGCTGHIATLIILGVKNAIRRNTFDGTTHRLMLHMSAISLVFCGVGMPLRAWNMAVGAKWPFDSIHMLTFEHYVVFVLLYVPTLLMTVLTLTRFTATFYALEHERWMKKLWIQLCFHLLPYVIPFGWFSIGGSHVLGIFKFVNAPGTGLAFPTPVNNTDDGRRLYRTFNIVQIGLNCFIPITMECVVYVAIFSKLYLNGRKIRHSASSAVGNTLQSVASVAVGTAAVAAAPHIARENSVTATHARLYGTNKVMQKRNIISSRQNNARLQQLRTIKVLAAVYCCELLLAFPNKFLFAVGLKETIGAQWPAVSIIFELLSFVMYACTPLIFARSTTEMRQAYKRLIFWTLGGCRCCGRQCVSPTKLVLRSHVTRGTIGAHTRAAVPATGAVAAEMLATSEKSSSVSKLRPAREHRGFYRTEIVLSRVTVLEKRQKFVKNEGIPSVIADVT